MLVGGREILFNATLGRYAVPAFNMSDYAMMKGLVEVSEAKGSPIILAIHPDELDHVGVDFLPAAISMAHRAKVPVAIHLDHGESIARALQAIQLGFTSVMIDGSALSFEENVGLTRGVVEAAHSVGLSVEGELGTIGKADADAEQGADSIVYTVPEDAVTFVSETGVDSLAVAIGTSHGIYAAGAKPDLRLDLVREIESLVDVPLVLHGGSNNSDSEVREAVRSGIRKVNISSDVKVAYYSRMREVLRDVGLREPCSIEPGCIEAMKVVAAQKIDLLGAAGRFATT